MSPRKPAVLRGGDGGGARDLREYLIATAARLIGQRGSAGLAVRDIAREAQVADGVLYNYFDDKDDLLAHALLLHVASVMTAMPRMPQAGTGTVAENLGWFIATGMDTLRRVAPAFAGLMSQPGVLVRFHAMVGGSPAFGAAGSPGDGAAGSPDGGADGSPGDGAAGSPDGGADGSPGDGAAGSPDGGADGPPQTETAPDEERDGPRGLPDVLRGYLRAEQRLGRVGSAVDIEATVALVVGTVHGEVLPRMLFAAPGSEVVIPPGLPERIAQTVIAGIAPRPPGAA